MSKTKFTNNAESVLIAAVNAGATSFQILAGDGGMFPDLELDEVTYIRLGTNASNEVVKITARVDDVLTCEPVTSDWPGATPVVLTMNAEALESFVQLDGHGQVVRGVEMVNYTKTVTMPVSNAGVLDLDLKNSNVFSIILTEDTTITISNPPEPGKAVSFRVVITQDATGGWGITLPVSVITYGGWNFMINDAAGSVTIYEFFTVNGGSDWYLVCEWLGAAPPPVK